MADKLSWSELRRTLAQRAGVSEKEANAFLAALNEQVVRALKTDKQVKINGMGTFRLQAVAPRKSVNVTTGEEIIIDGYNKIAFSPEAGVKELVEKVRVERIEAGGDGSDIKSENGEIDPLKKLGEQAEEIVGLLGDLGQSPNKGQRDDVQSTKEEAQVSVEPEKPEEQKETVVASLTEPIVTPPAEPEIPKEPETPKEPEVPVFVYPAPKEPEKPKEKPKKKYHFFRDTLICVVILLLLLLVGYFFLRNRLSDWIGDLMFRQPTPVETITPPVATTDTVAQENTTPPDTMSAEEIMTKEQIIAEFMEISGEAPDNTTPNEQLYEELITIEPMHEASRLTWMSKRYYGSKTYWPYLYDANKDHISNPSKIEVGTPIRVPKLTATQLDTTNESSRLALERLREEAEKACGK